MVTLEWNKYPLTLLKKLTLNMDNRYLMKDCTCVLHFRSNVFGLKQVLSLINLRPAHICCYQQW